MTPTPTVPGGREPVWCGNHDHLEFGGKRVAAVVRLEFPSGRFRTTTACRTDMYSSLRNAIVEGIPVVITPLESR